MLFLRFFFLSHLWYSRTSTCLFICIFVFVVVVVVVVAAAAVVVAVAIVVVGGGWWWFAGFVLCYLPPSPLPPSSLSPSLLRLFIGLIIIDNVHTHVPINSSYLILLFLSWRTVNAATPTESWPPTIRNNSRTALAFSVGLIGGMKGNRLRRPRN